MSPFEAHILIQQAITTTSTIPSATGSSFPNDGGSSCNVEKILLEALKSHRLNPNLRFKNESLLSTAIKKGCANLLKLFLEHGADPNLKSYENGRYEPALITAVRYKSLRCVQILLEHGANLSKTNFYGTDAVFQAVHENALEILDCLLCYDEQSQHDKSYYHQPQRQKRDVPTAGFSSFSSSSLPPHQSIIIQKTTATMKETDSKGGGENKAVSSAAQPAAQVVVLSREKSFNNNKSCSKGHDSDDHVLCPFYYALNSALSYPSKRASLALLLQSYYKCKCLEEIASCCGAAGGTLNRTNSPIEADQVKECLRIVLSSLPNFSPFSFSSHGFPEADKSVLLAGIHDDDDDDDVVRQQYYYGTHHHHDSLEVHADNENDIRFQLGKAPAAGERGGGGGRERNEPSSRNLFPYKVYKIQGKCHVIKENESSTSSPPSPTAAAQQRPSSSYVVLVGPLKLSCITREVIRDQIMRSAQTTCTATSTAATANGSTQSESTNNTMTTTTSTITTVAPHHQLPPPPPLQSTKGDAVSVIGTQEEYYLRKTRKRNFRKSLETLTMPSSLMDYILYRNIQWTNNGGRINSSSSAMNRQGGKNGKQKENNELNRSTTNIDNIRLIKRDLELNINYFAIYIY